MLVAGVDGCRAGWVVVLADISEPQSIDAVVVVANFAAVLALTEACEAVVVDIPIGLSLRLPRPGRCAGSRPAQAQPGQQCLSFPG